MDPAPLMGVREQRLDMQCGFLITLRGRLHTVFPKIKSKPIIAVKCQQSTTL
jgi:hypothetical protein